jgi:hypothetical protein
MPSPAGVRSPGTGGANLYTQTLGTASGLSGAAGKMCLDLRGNMLDGSTKLFELIHDSAGTFGRLTSGNTGTVSESGTFGTVASCPRPAF